jgi:hypothetical protein
LKLADSLSRFRAVLDFGKQLRLDPDALVCDPLFEGLRLPNQRLQALPQVGGRDWKLVRFEKHIDVEPRDIPCASWRLAALSRQGALSSVAV